MVGGDRIPRNAAAGALSPLGGANGPVPYLPIQHTCVHGTTTAYAAAVRCPVANGSELCPLVVHIVQLSRELVVTAVAMVELTLATAGRKALHREN